MELNGQVSEVSGNNVSVLDSDNYEDDKTPSKRKKEPSGWYLVKTFDHLSQAKEAIRREHTWRLHKKENESHRRYRCTRNQQCQAELYLLIEITKFVFVYHTESEHNHEALGLLSNYGISQEIRDDIDLYSALYLRQYCIKTRLEDKYGARTPSSRKLRSYLNKQRRFNLLERQPVKEKAAISLGELGTWLAEHAKVPENEHEPYVVTYSLNWGATPSFCFAITTKYLLKLTVHAKNIMTDTTNRFHWQGYLVFAVGTTDKNNSFFPICLGISSTESKHDFQMIFSNLKESAMSLHAHSMAPSVLLCDGNKSVQEAFREVFGSEPVIKICWQRAKSEIKKKVEELVEKSYRKPILEDLELLRSAQAQDMFTVGLEAFLKRYINHREFLAYFKTHWVDQNQNWYLGAAVGLPDNNKALNVFLKDFGDNTNTSFDAVPIFLGISAFRVKEWSQKKILECFSNVPNIQLEDWKEAYEILKVDPVKPILVCNGSMYRQYLFLSPPEVETSRKEWDSFDEFKKKVKILGHLFVLTSLTTCVDKWMESSCTCVDYCRNYKCKHIIALAIKLEYVAIPPTVLGKIAGVKRKREVSGFIVP